MQRLIDPSSIGVFVLSATFVVRARHAIRVPAARPSWLAAGVGALSLFCCGTLVPITVLDSLIGGTNAISLLQNICAAIALWLVMQAVVTEGNYPLRNILKSPLLVGIIAFTIPFFFVDRGPTAKDFMFDRADQVPTFLYSAIYLTLIGGICLYLGAKVWTSGSRSYSALIIGAGIVAVGCFFQFGALGSIAFSWLPTETSDALYAIGLAGLTGGVVCMAANVAAVAFRRVRSTRQVARSIASMEELMHRKGLLADVRATPAENDLARLYEEVIAVNDHIHTEGNALSDEEMKQVSAASDLVARKMFEDAPRPVRYPRPLRAIVNWAVKGKASQPAAADHSNTALIPTAEPAMTSRESA